MSYLRRCTYASEPLRRTDQFRSGLSCSHVTAPLVNSSISMQRSAGTLEVKYQLCTACLVMFRLLANADLGPIIEAALSITWLRYSLRTYKLICFMQVYY